MGESAEPAFNGRKNTNQFTAFYYVHPLCALSDTDVHTQKTRNTSVIFPPYADKTETNKIKIKHHNTVFFDTKTWDTHPYASPEGLETTPPLGNVNGGLQHGLSEPPCGLRPCASPLKIFPGTQRVTGTQNLYQASKTILSPISHVNANQSLQTHKTRTHRTTMRAVRRSSAGAQ